MAVNQFVYYNPTRIYFGNEQMAHIGEEAKKYGNRAVLVYGGGSIKKNGLYDRIMKSLKQSGVQVAECAGIEPNPQYTSVNRAAKISRENRSMRKPDRTWPGYQL